VKLHANGLVIAEVVDELDGVDVDVLAVDAGEGERRLLREAAALRARTAGDLGAGIGHVDLVALHLQAVDVAGRAAHALGVHEVAVLLRLPLARALDGDANELAIAEAIR